MNYLAEQTLGNIVANNFKAASVFAKYQLDFCCGGKRTLTEACIQKEIDPADVVKDLNLLTEQQMGVMSFNEMSASELISYILIHHHFYTKQHMPLILGHVEKVAFKHGERYLYMPKVAKLFAVLQEEMLQHMQKEERILFPAIKEIERQQLQGGNTDSSFIEQPIAVMEAEHEEAGNILAQIRELTNNFTPPVDACTTFKISLMELHEFENNLHQHVHLENNILFPMAEKMTTKDLVSE